MLGPASINKGFQTQLAKSFQTVTATKDICEVQVLADEIKLKMVAAYQPLIIEFLCDCFVCFFTKALIFLLECKLS